MANKEFAEKLENNLEMVQMNIDYLKEYLAKKYPDDLLPSYFDHIKQVMDFMDKDIQTFKDE